MRPCGPAFLQAAHSLPAATVHALPPALHPPCAGVLPAAHPLHAVQQGGRHAGHPARPHPAPGHRLRGTLPNLRRRPVRPAADAADGGESGGRGTAEPRQQLAGAHLARCGVCHCPQHGNGLWCPAGGHRSAAQTVAAPRRWAAGPFCAEVAAAEAQLCAVATLPSACYSCSLISPARRLLLPCAGPGRLVPAAAAFGNSFTLPAVFLTTLLPPALADRALGYAALFLLAWSPCLWSLGMALIAGKQQQPPTAAVQAAAAAAEQQQQELEQQQGSGGGGPKPLAWRQPRVVDVTPAAASSSSGSSSEEQLELPTPPSWAERLAQHPFTAQLCQFGAQVLTPPVLAILAGMLTGLTPAGRALLAASSSSGAAAAAAGASTVAAVLPPELGLLHAVAKATLEVRRLRGAAVPWVLLLLARQWAPAW